MFTQEQKIEKLKVIAKESVDIKGIGFYSLGAYRKQLNEKTKDFAEKIINSNFSNFVGKKIDCIETK